MSTTLTHHPATEAPAARPRTILAASLVGTTVEWYVFQGSGIWASGLTPVVLTGLLVFGGGGPWWAAGYLATTAVISVAAVALMPRWIGWRPQWTGSAPW